MHWLMLPAVLVAIAGGVVGVAWHEVPCHDWPFVDQGDHVVSNGTWVRLDMNSVALVQGHSCLDGDGYATKSWEEVVERRLSPEPARTTEEGS